MKEHYNTATRARLRTLLAIGYAAFIIYASLSPFVGWREQGLDFVDVLGAPLRLTFTPFDAALNLVSYLPFGLLVTLALRGRLSVLASVLSGALLGLLLSVSMEYSQMYLPTRISSNMDVLSNSVGAFLGVLIAVSITSWTWLFSNLEAWRRHIFHYGVEMDFGLALLALWIFGQINPTLPMLGNVFISEVARQPFAATPADQFEVWQAIVVALNLLMLGVLMLTVLRIPRKVVSALFAVLGMVVAAKFFAAAVLLKSWAMLLWINSEAVIGVLLGLLGVFLILRWPRNRVIGFGVIVSLSYFVIVNVVFGSNNPAAAKSIYQWHYVHLLNYNGLAQTIALIFPLLLLFHFWQIRRL